mmetsp:Transcript_35694/g.81422  ORF Transcript_35694/g.81422 Transcript_35694/m.81422 type:complete len:121 (+) Transcript_35694:31-393(+)
MKSAYGTFGQAPPASSSRTFQVALAVGAFCLATVVFIALAAEDEPLVAAQQPSTAAISRYQAIQRIAKLRLQLADPGFAHLDPMRLKLELHDAEKQLAKLNGADYSSMVLKADQKAHHWN